MICKLCSSPIVNEADRKNLTVRGDTFPLHKKCLRGATRQQLIEKGIIKPDDPGWWAKI